MNVDGVKTLKDVDRIMPWETVRRLPLASLGYNSKL
jgi:hypothetical protein